MPFSPVLQLDPAITAVASSVRIRVEGLENLPQTPASIALKIRGQDQRDLVPEAKKNLPQAKPYNFDNRKISLQLADVLLPQTRSL